MIYILSLNPEFFNFSQMTDHSHILGIVDPWYKDSKKQVKDKRVYLDLYPFILKVTIYTYTVVPKGRPGPRPRPKSRPPALPGPGQNLGINRGQSPAPAPANIFYPLPRPKIVHLPGAQPGIL